MKDNKKIIKEAPTQSLPTPKPILNYTDDEVIAAIKKEVEKNKDYTIIKIQSNADQYYNVVISYVVPEDEYSFEFDRYKYIQELHKYRIELFTELSKVLPVVNVNLAAFDFVKGNDEMRFALTVLLSNTNNKEWVTGKVKKVDAKQRAKLLQLESKGKKKINEVYFDPSVIREREFNYPFEDYVIAVYDTIDDLNQYTYEEIDNLISFYKSKIKSAWYDNISPEDIVKRLVKRKNKYDQTEDEGSIVEAKEDKKFHKVMDEFGKGTLKTNAGKKVTDQKQAVAIGYSESGKDKQNESENEQEGTWINEDMVVGDDGNLIDYNPEESETVRYVGNSDFMQHYLINYCEEWGLDFHKKTVRNVTSVEIIIEDLKGRSTPEELDAYLLDVSEGEKSLYFGCTLHNGGLQEGVELGYEFQPTTVPGAPMNDEDFLECNNLIEGLLEGKFYKLTQAKGMLIEKVQLISKNGNKYLFEKVNTGEKVRINKNDLSKYITEIKKTIIQEGWKTVQEFEVSDAFDAVEKLRGLSGILSANAITQDKIVVKFNNKKISGEIIKHKLLEE